MYKVLLVDDEELVIKGISSLISWEQHGFELLAAASNGKQALELFRSNPVDIVITDIRMPVMDGLQLIKQLKEESPLTEYIVLSGYGEYDYTSSAMELGVKHYLLKPSNEIKILEVLKKVTAKIEERALQQQFWDRLQSDFNKMLPHVKEQLLRDIVLTGMYNKRDFDYFMELFMIDQQRFQLVLFTCYEETDYIDKFALKNIAEEVFKEDGVYLSTIIQDQILLLVRADDFAQLSEKIKQVQRAYRTYYKLELVVALSDEGAFSSIRSMYESVKRCLSFGSTFPEGCIITPQDVMDIRRELPLDAAPLAERLALAVRTGSSADISAAINEASQSFEAGLFDMEEAKKFCLDMFLVVIRQADGGLDEFVPAIPALYNMSSLRAAFQFLEQTALELAKRNTESAAKRQSDLVDAVLGIVEQNISNPDLSLKWIGSELLYVNVDYLGKLFAKKTGSKFSSYLTRRRMEYAMKLMKQEHELRVVDIAVMTGYPEDAQYFSKVFKKYTGMTPTEYMRA